MWEQINWERIELSAEIFFWFVVIGWIIRVVSGFFLKTWTNHYLSKAFFTGKEWFVTKSKSLSPVQVIEQIGRDHFSENLIEEAKIFEKRFFKEYELKDQKMFLVACNLKKQRVSEDLLLFWMKRKKMRPANFDELLNFWYQHSKEIIRVQDEGSVMDIYVIGSTFNSHFNYGKEITRWYEIPVVTSQKLEAEEDSGFGFSIDNLYHKEICSTHPIVSNGREHYYLAVEITD